MQQLVLPSLLVVPQAVEAPPESSMRARLQELVGCKVLVKDVFLVGNEVLPAFEGVVFDAPLLQLGGGDLLFELLKHHVEIELAGVLSLQKHHASGNHDLVGVELPAVERVFDVVAVAVNHQSLHLLLAFFVVLRLLSPDGKVTLDLLVHVLVVFGPDLVYSISFDLVLTDAFVAVLLPGLETLAKQSSINRFVEYVFVLIP